MSVASITARLLVVQRQREKLLRMENTMVEGMPRFSAFLSKWVRHSGMTMKEVAERCGVSRFALYSWLVGRSLPRERSLGMMALALGTNETVLAAMVAADKRLLGRR